MHAVSKCKPLEPNLNICLGRELPENCQSAPQRCLVKGATPDDVCGMSIDKYQINKALRRIGASETIEQMGTGFTLAERVVTSYIKWNI
jgi:hypothetical protein